VTLKLHDYGGSGGGGGCPAGFRSRGQAHARRGPHVKSKISEGKIIMIEGKGEKKMK
jgi:hypothetical protein